MTENRTNFTVRDRHHNIVLNWVGVRINQAGSVNFEIRLNENVVTIRNILRSRFKEGGLL